MSFGLDIDDIHGHAQNVERNPDNPSAWYELGIAYAGPRRWDEAIAAISWPSRGFPGARRKAFPSACG